ncbi:MAG: PAS domain S-box protein, partial [Ignavibacteriales bacterium]
GAEEALREAHEESEKRVEDRTRELIRANEELRFEIAERQRMEEMLLESRNFYLKLFDEFPTLVWKSGIDTKCDYFNRSWLEFTGRTMEQEIGESWTEGVHPEDLERCVKTYLNAFDGGDPFGMEYRLRRHDGEYRWIVDFGRPFYNLEGEFAGYVGSCYDITERKRAEGALRKSEERHRDLVENSEDLICTHDLEGNIISANQAPARRLGYEQAEEFLGLNISDFLAPGVRHLFNPYINALLKEGHAHGLMKILTRDGEERILEYRNSLRTEGIDKPIVRGMAHDVTERNRVEKALQESNQFNKAIIWSASEGIIVYDCELRYVLWNRFMEELTGLPAERVIGKYALDLFPHLHEQGVYSMLQMALMGETVSSPDVPYYVPQTGKSGWVSGSYGPHRDANGNIISVIGLVRDTTERKRIETALRESEERYRSLIENAPVCIHEIDLSEHPMSMNRVGLQIMNAKDESQVCGLSYLDAVAPDDRRRISTLLTSAYEGEASECEFRGVGEHVFASSFIPLKGADGSILKLMGITQDITERKRVEKALRENLIQLSKKNRYETIISTVTRSVHQSINLQEVLENAVESMNKNIDRADIIGIYLAEGEEAVLKAHRGLPAQYIERAARILYPKGLTWKTIIEGKPRYCADVDRDEFISLAGRELGMKSYLSMPIRFESRTIGCINIGSLKKDSFDEEELRLLETVAQQTEVALDKAQIAEALRQSEEQYRTLFDQSPVGVYIYTIKNSGLSNAMNVWPGFYSHLVIESLDLV